MAWVEESMGRNMPLLLLLDEGGEVVVGKGVEEALLPAFVSLLMLSPTARTAWLNLAPEVALEFLFLQYVKASQILAENIFNTSGDAPNTSWAALLTTLWFNLAVQAATDIKNSW